MDATGKEYALGQSPQEYRRLVRQGEAYRTMTHRFFEDAGIEPGMRVLDLGAGAGDVSLLLSEMVGANGQVVGVEMDPGAVRFAQSRAAQAGAGNITFVPSDISLYEPEASFDAIVGRLILMYQSEPSAVLARLIKHLKPCGIVAFMELWLTPPPGPDSPVLRIVTCITETLLRSGACIDLGPRLHKVFAAAGLPAPKMRFEAVVDGSENSPLFQLIADSYANLLPKAVEYGVPIAEGITIESIPAIFQAAMNAVGYSAVVLPTILAWSRAE